MKLKWKAGMDRQEQERAIESALLLGFNSTSAEFPVTSMTEGYEVPENLEDLAKMFPERACEVPEGYLAATDAAHEVPKLDFRQKTGLELLFSEGLFLKDCNNDLLPDVLDMRMVLPEQMDDSLAKAACDIAFRFGMETTAYEGTLIAESGYTGNALILEMAEECSIWIENTEKCVIRVHIGGSGKALEEFVSLLCGQFPLLPENRTWQELLMDMADSMVMRNLDGELAYLESAGRETKVTDAYLSPEFQEREADYSEYFNEVKFHNHKSGEEVYRKSYDIPWEVDVLKKTLQEKLYPQIQQGDRVRILGSVSEDHKVRRKAAAELTENLRAAGAIVENVELLCAYKQGYSWIDESVIPRLTGEDTAQIVIRYKPFLPDGQTEWLDEDGATPSYNNLQAETPDKWFDLPIRYLQELYPVEDAICSKLGIARDQVIFKAYDGAEDITYHVQAVDSKGHTFYENSYQAWCSERPYMDEYPNMGKVHPSTGYLTAEVNGEVVLSERIETDVERIWEIYQSEVLPDCRKYVEQTAGENISLGAQPFFQELKLEVTASEPDFRTGSREDLISSLDALHEDMYFMGSDYFKNFGVTRAGVMLDAPGLILPVIHNGEGKPQFEVTLYRQLRKEASVECGGEVLSRPSDREHAGAFISRLDYDNGRMAVTVRVESPVEGVPAAYVKLLEKGLLEAGNSFSHVSRLVLETENGSYGTAVKEAELPVQDLDIDDIDISEHELIGYARCMEIINQLKRVPGISVFRTARSYMGRSIYALELLPREAGYVSRTKRINSLPVEIINTRHHANEVSGTNGMFMLLRKLLKEDEWKTLPDKLNLIMVPMENADGAAIHYELQKEHPYWKFHVARFNAIGKEFYHEHFLQETIHREAMGLTRLFVKYAPDMIVDNHGVPSHEWEQQFSGYTSPSFKGFWLPRSLLYGYFWTVTDEQYKDNYPVNKKMEDVIAEEIAKDPEMTKWNTEWSAQFEKYAHAWMPRLFPANYYKDMINYWIPFPYNPSHRYPSIRYPWITTVAYTSEIADETAQGEYLHLCAKAHVAHDIATIRMLIGSRSIFRQSCDITDNKVSISSIRKRPMITG